MADVVRTRRCPPHFVRTRIDAWTTRYSPSSFAAPVGTSLRYRLAIDRLLESEDSELH